MKNIVKILLMLAIMALIASCGEKKEDEKIFSEQITVPYVVNTPLGLIVFEALDVSGMQTIAPLVQEYKQNIRIYMRHLQKKDNLGTSVRSLDAYKEGKEAESKFIFDSLYLKVIPLKEDFYCLQIDCYKKN